MGSVTIMTSRPESTTDICTMEEKDIKAEVISSFGFDKVVAHMKEYYGSELDIATEQKIASDLIDTTLSTIKDNGRSEISRGNYVCVVEKEDGKIVDLLLEYSKTVSSYRYCE